MRTHTRDLNRSQQKSNTINSFLIHVQYSRLEMKFVGAVVLYLRRLTVSISSCFGARANIATMASLVGKAHNIHCTP